MALLMLLIPISTRVIYPGKHNQEQTAKTRTLSVEHEMRMKTEDVQHDMNATAELCASQCSKDIGELFAMAGKPQPDPLGRMNALINMHPQMLRLDWLSPGRPAVQAGKVTHDVLSALDGHIGKAGRGHCRKPPLPVAGRIL